MVGLKYDFIDAQFLLYNSRRSVVVLKNCFDMVYSGM